MTKISILAATAALFVWSDAALAASSVTVSCYRGPWNQVIWDRANPKFINSLEANGLDIVDARVIADSLCRDPRLVNNPEAMAEEVRRVLSKARRQ